MNEQNRPTSGTTRGPRAFFLTAHLAWAVWIS